MLADPYRQSPARPKLDLRSAQGRTRPQATSLRKHMRCGDCPDVGRSARQPCLARWSPRLRFCRSAQLLSMWPGQSGQAPALRQCTLLLRMCIESRKKSSVRRVAERKPLDGVLVLLCHEQLRAVSEAVARAPVRRSVEEVRPVSLGWGQRDQLVRRRTHRGSVQCGRARRRASCLSRCCSTAGRRLRTAPPRVGCRS